MNASRSRTRLLPWSAAVALICSISLFTGAAAADTLVYSNDFESPVGAEWSNQLMSATPAGHGFLGRFAWDAVTLSLDDMAAHASVTLQFDLYIISSWDGNVEFSGPDIWGVEVVDGPRLMRTSFARWDIGTGNTRPPFATDSLGYGGWGDDVYRYTFTFPHSASTLDLRFYGDNIQDVGDESWGLDTVQVWTADTVADPATPPPAPPTNVRAIPGNRVVDVMWDAATNVGSGLDRVIVIRNPPPANSRDFHYVAPGATATEVKAISTDGTPHAYRILVVDTAGNVAMSEWSNSVVPFWEPLPGVNQLTNGDFESGELAPWGEHGGADRVIDTTNPYEGAASLYIRSHGVGWVYQESGVHYVLPEFRGGQEYTFSAFMRADEPRRVNMRAYREGGHWNARGERHQDVDTEWREYYVTFTPESDVVPTRLAINAAESTVGFWVDNVQFYEGPYQPAGENPVLSIVEPAVHYAILDGNSATVEVGVHNHTGAWHWQLDAPFPESGPAGGVGVSNGRTALLTGLAPGVAHTFYAALVDGNGDVLQPSVLASTQLSVPGATPHVLDDEPKVNEGGYIASWLHLDQPIMTHVDATRALTRNTVGAETILLPIEGRRFLRASTTLPARGSASTSATPQRWRDSLRSSTTGWVWECGSTAI